jgi:opacity protein-like surface antigen
MLMRPAVLLFMLSLTTVAWADDNRGATVAGSVSATNMDARTQFSFAGAFGYRFSDVVGLELETTVVPAMRSAYPGVSFENYPPPPVTTLTTLSAQFYPSPLYTNTGGRMVIFSNNVRITIPTTTPRLEPYFVAGGGVASVRRTADFRYPMPFPLGATVVIGIPVPDYRISALPVRSSEVDLALTLGGGVGIKLMSHVWLDADVRVIRLMGSEDRNVGRFGVGARYRF